MKWIVDVRNPHDDLSVSSVRAVYHGTQSSMSGVGDFTLQKKKIIIIISTVGVVIIILDGIRLSSVRAYAYGTAVSALFVGVEWP